MLGLGPRGPVGALTQFSLTQCSLRVRRWIATRLTSLDEDLEASRRFGTSYRSRLPAAAWSGLGSLTTIRGVAPDARQATRKR